MTATSPTSLLIPVKVAGLVTGLVIAAALVALLRIPQEDGRLGADARLVATTSGGIKADSGAFLTGRHLTSGGEAATGTLRVTNDSRGEALISFRALAGDSPLARQMHIELSLDGKKLAGGSLTEMSRWTGRLRLTRGSSRTLDASAWIPGSVREGYEGKTADINLQVRGKVVSR